MKILDRGTRRQLVKFLSDYEGLLNDTPSIIPKLWEFSLELKKAPPEVQKRIRNTILRLFEEWYIYDTGFLRRLMTLCYIHYQKDEEFKKEIKRIIRGITAWNIRYENKWHYLVLLLKKIGGSFSEEESKFFDTKLQNGLGKIKKWNLPKVRRLKPK